MRNSGEREKQMALEIESWEDRSGGPPGPTSFGFVYFNDESRVGYSPATPDHEDVWEPRSNGGGKFVPVTPQHLAMARNLLKREGIL